MAGNEGGLPPKRRLGISKILSGILPGLARIEGVGVPPAGACIVDAGPVFRATTISRHGFCMMFFDCFLGSFFLDFGATCGAILALKKGPNGSSGPSWRILGASWALFRVILAQKSAIFRCCFCKMSLIAFGEGFSWMLVRLVAPSWRSRRAQMAYLGRPGAS